MTDHEDVGVRAPVRVAADDENDAARSQRAGVFRLAAQMCAGKGA
ncbi:hypothetical protein ACWC9Q_17280 [Streptomyces sp. NPDC001142]